VFDARIRGSTRRPCKEIIRQAWKDYKRCLCGKRRISWFTRVGMERRLRALEDWLKAVPTKEGWERGQPPRNKRRPLTLLVHFNLPTNCCFMYLYRPMMFSLASLDPRDFLPYYLAQMKPGGR